MTIYIHEGWVDFNFFQKLINFLNFSVTFLVKLPKKNIQNKNFRVGVSHLTSLNPLFFKLKLQLGVTNLRKSMNAA